MKKYFIISLFSFLFNFLFGQDTLRNYNPLDYTPVADFSNEGYYSGHNNYGDEEFAEKYQIVGNIDIMGIVAIHRGVTGTSTLNASYKIYDVGNDELPASQKSIKRIPYNNIPVDGTPFIVMLDNIVNTSSNFFVSFDLGDYIHNNPGTKKIAITHSPDGVRTIDDLAVFGRNVVRWHSHGNNSWKDYRTENYEDYQPAIHFSLFPIIQYNSPTSILNLNDNIHIGAIYPNPSIGNFYIPIYSLEENKAICQIFDLNGKLLIEEPFNLLQGNSNYTFNANHLVSGTYILLINTKDGNAAQKIIIQ